MIRLDRVTLWSGNGAQRRLVLDRASFAFTPGLWRIASEPASDAQRLVRFLAGYRAAEHGQIQSAGLCSWPIAQFAPLGMYLTGADLVDTLCALYALDRAGTFRFFQDMLDEPAWLGHRFDRWPQAAQRQFGLVAFLAPAFDVFLLDVAPVLRGANFAGRWRALFQERSAGKVAIFACADHRALGRDFAGTSLYLSAGALRRIEPAVLPQPERVAG